MKSTSKYRKGVILFIIAGLFSGLLLAACDGTAFVDVSFDATEGVGNIVITGDQNQSGQSDTQTNGDANMSQVLLFGLVVALLLGTVAIVISLARRPRPE
jgi:hypothetical protein